MSGTEDSEQRDWNEIKTIKRIPDSSQPVQKFCERWLKIFSPWLSRCKDNPNKSFCRACQCRLDSNRCHLQRHSKTTKHARNLEIFIEKGEEAARQNFKMRQERSKYYQRKRTNALLDNLEMDAGTVKQEMAEGESDYDEEESLETVDPIEEHEARTQNTRLKNHINTRSLAHSASAAVQKINNPATLKKERIKLYMQIQKDKNDLMNTFKELMGVRNNNVQNPSTTVQPPKEKNHIDLFFESVSSSVKALSPKLMAEAKMRVSQLIGELELRGLTENETSNSVPENTIVVSPSSGNSYILHRTIQHNAIDAQQNREEQVTSQDYEAMT